VVTVQPSSVVVVAPPAGAVRVRPGDGAGDVGPPPADGSSPAGAGPVGVAGAGRRVAGVDGTGGSEVAAAPLSRSTETGAPASGAAVRSTGSIATEASAMLVSVAAHQPSTGHVREDRTGP
jgi:hypothetical protein